MKEKCCSKCRVLKPLNDFNKRKNGKYGYDHYCKLCDDFRHRESRAIKNNISLSKEDLKYKLETQKNIEVFKKTIPNYDFKRCSYCKKIKSINEFHKRKTSKDGHDHYCKICSNLKHKERYINPTIKKNKKFYQIKKNYNLSEIDFKNMIINQNNKCLICNNEFKYIYIDHNHKTGNVRGLLCPKCNLLLGQCNDNIEILESAIQYLKEHN